MLGDLDVRVVLPGPSPLGVPPADGPLERRLASYGVQVLRSARVTGPRGRRVTIATPEGDRELDELAYAHVVPHYRAPPLDRGEWPRRRNGGRSGGRRLVDAAPPRHPTVWSLGDVADLGTRPSGGALRKQVDVLAHNIAANGDASMRHYDGYTVMPITVGRRRLMLVEVDRDGRPSPSVPFPDLIRPRRATWWVDRYALPVTYFRRILRGRV